MAEYPLWCVDTGPREGDERFVGPFDSHDEATEHASVYTEDDFEDPYPLVTRCRIVEGSDNRSCVHRPKVEWENWDGLGDGIILEGSE